MGLNPPIRDWSAQRVWIVGASSGIGAALADALLSRGARVAVSARSAERLAERFGGQARALAVAADVLDRASLERARDAIVARWSDIDLAIACAGTWREMRAHRPDLEAARSIWRTNFEGAFDLYAACLPLWQAAREGEAAAARPMHGAFCVVSSVAGFYGLPNSLAYGASKAALTNLTESLWLDLSQRGVSVSVVHPGFVATPLTAPNRFAMPALIQPPEAARHIVRGLERGDFEIHFPKRFTLAMKAIGLLPSRLRLPLLRRITRT